MVGAKARQAAVRAFPKPNDRQNGGLESWAVTNCASDKGTSDALGLCAQGFGQLLRGDAQER